RVPATPSSSRRKSRRRSASRECFRASASARLPGIRHRKSLAGTPPCWPRHEEKETDVKKLLVGIAMLGLALTAFAQGKPAEPLGMVIDVQGKGTLTDAGKKAPLEMLSYLKPAAEIQLDAGAQITVTWYEGAKELKFNGPARLKVGAKGIEVASG